ncbi:endonuclease/exonuclease/phosphatase family protein [Winogradskyella immobilis]|uniref:Endonuclease/exonuclease/phosphatase family protein n=1 Tax=Winogradskyella immobilis TaxID=2816852 RepID=A0ABS8EJR3_9FLAO|nr:endonuclease/exonuclease/phosphatase family protein [Winogradskyella immobilis]MCC1483287.1 endonuclease/exonuclease/phosphatase family protein [Winogradskyella immobilis]MCG0015381.1 endonuclease/exonuclease/phosphatase family protein [Winogradskyella immobilis]
MKMNRILLFSLLFFIAFNAYTQNEKRYKIHTVAFYNLENLFDTINDPNKFDERSPIMELNSDRAKIYERKLKNMARAVADIGSDQTNNSPAIIGVCEIENRKVLEDLVNDPLLLGKDYGIVHFESPDARGIDVALLYQKALFQPINSKSHELFIYDDLSRKRVFTRNQLLVSGKLEGDLIHVIVNHWPSRSGGEARSRSKRVGAAKLNKRIIDSLQSIDPYAKVFVMGDLNDNPTNASVKDVLKAHSNRKKVPLKGIYNPFENQFKKEGLGTTGYRDSWSLFDQIMVTKPLLDKDFSSFKYYKAGIHNKPYLVNRRGRYVGYPFRSFADGGYTGGFSDHFPVYVYVIREVKDE